MEDSNRTVCKNPWCKATFIFNEGDMVDDITSDQRDHLIGEILDQHINKIPPPQCPKCRSFNSELSAGVEWREKKYEGSRMDGVPHSISIKIKKF